MPHTVTTIKTLPDEDATGGKATGGKATGGKATGGKAGKAGRDAIYIAKVGIGAIQ
jgi:hypothetical protein